MTVRIFTYWEGPRPAAIRLCLRTLERNVPGMEIWTPEVWRAAYDGSLGPWRAIAKQRANLKSDILRAWLLRTYGGLWIDADTIVFRDLRPLWEEIELGADFVCYRVDRGWLCTALMASRPEGRVIAAQSRRIAEKLISGRRLPALAFGPKCLRRSIAEAGSRIHYVPQKLIHPLPWWTATGRRQRLLGAGPCPFHPRAFGFGLTHGAIERLPESEADLLASPTPVGQAFRHAGLEGAAT